MYELILQAIIGAIGGNVAGGLLKKLSLGFVGNTLAGLVGGGAGGFLLQMMGIDVPTIDPSNLSMASLLPNIGAGVGGGGILMIVIGFIKNLLGK